MRTLILNSSNIVAGTNNSILRYNFSGGGVNLVKGQKLALASLQMYYSIFNITAANRNNVFSYVWVNGTTYTVTVPDGFYDIVALNNYLRFTMVQNTHYLTTTTGDFVYLLSLGTNAVRYSIQLNCFRISTAIATANSWSLPSGATWVLPTNTIVPELVVPSLTTSNFGLIIGFNAGTYPNAVIAGVPPGQTQTPAYTTDQSFLSTYTPQVTPLSSFILTCSLINNNYAVPNNLIYSFSPQGTVGSQFTVAPNQYVFIDVNPGQYNSFDVQFIDQNFRPIVIQDPNMVIQIVVSDVNDNIGL
jgi:hypothetical protein